MADIQDPEKRVASSSGSSTKEETIKSIDKPATSTRDAEKRGSHGSSTDEMENLQKLDSKVVKIGEHSDDPLAHLPEHERRIIERQLEVPPVQVTYTTLYRYATRNDLIIMAVSALCAIGGGAVMPLMTVCLSPYVSSSG
jgi:ATP-binding cassette, subfamily B (MDR/TAP), member 1